MRNLLRKLLFAGAFAFAPIAISQPSQAVPITTNGNWVVVFEAGMTAPQFFNSTWDFNCLTTTCVLDVTDLFIISDLFEVYDNAFLIDATSVVPSWDVLGCADPNDPACFTADPDTAWADLRYSKGSFLLGAGLHSITIRDIFIPPSVAGGPFTDGTVALRVTAVPLPGALGLLACGLAALGFMGRRRKQEVISAA